MAARTPELLEVIDRKGITALGYSRVSVDHLYAALPNVMLPGQRTKYLRRRDVADYLDSHTRRPVTPGGVTTHQ